MKIIWKLLQYRVPATSQACEHDAEELDYGKKHLPLSG